MPSARRIWEADHVHAADLPAPTELGSGRSPVPVAAVMDFVAMTPGEHDQMIEQLELRRESSGLSSLLFHWVRVYPDGVRVIEIWRELSPFTSFLEMGIRPMLRDLDLPDPELSIHQIPGYLIDGEI